MKGSIDLLDVKIALLVSEFILLLSSYEFWFSLILWFTGLWVHWLREGFKSALLLHSNLNKHVTSLVVSRKLLSGGCSGVDGIKTDAALFCSL